MVKLVEGIDGQWLKWESADGTLVYLRVRDVSCVFVEDGGASTGIITLYGRESAPAPMNEVAQLLGLWQ